MELQAFTVSLSLQEFIHTLSDGDSRPMFSPINKSYSLILPAAQRIVLDKTKNLSKLKKSNEFLLLMTTERNKRFDI
jgi:hypothetical protein